MTKNSELQRVLVLSPHTDDAEFGCGGSLSKLVQNGADVQCIIFSTCEESIPEGFPKDVLHHESRAALTKIGLKESGIHVWNYPVRNFDLSRQEILEKLVAFRKQFHPDLVFLPCSQDFHQDHSVIHTEGVRAFKNTRLLGYEFPWNCLTSDARFFFSLSKECVQAKVDAIGMYKSQQHRAYASAEYLESTARNHGLNSGVQYAERFEVVRWYD